MVDKVRKLSASKTHTLDNDWEMQEVYSYFSQTAKFLYFSYPVYFPFSRSQYLIAAKPCKGTYVHINFPLQLTVMYDCNSAFPATKV